MYVIYPADEVVSLTFTSHWQPRPRPRPTLDTLAGPPVPAPFPAPAPYPAPARSRTPSFLKTAPPEIAERAPASPTPSLDRPAKLRERTKVKLLKKLGRVEDPEFGKIVRTPAPDEFELPAPLPTPAFSRKNIFDRNFDALFEVATTPQFGAHIRVTTPEPDHRPDVVAEHFPSSCSLLPPRPYSEPASITPSPTPSTRTSTPSTPTLQRSSYEGPNSKPKKVSFFRKLSRSKGVSQSPEPSWKMIQQPSMEMALRELTHSTHNDQLKNQQQVTFKLVKTVSDFSSQLSQLYERHSAELQMLVANFRKRNSELRKERTTCPSSLFHTWESLIQEVEADVVTYSTASASLERVVATPLVDKTFHMKVQARKLFAHREGCELLLAKADEQLNKSRQEYRSAFVTYSNNPNPGALAAYYDSHNTYVQQLTATNAMLDQYHKFTLPTILQELEEILTDVTAAVSEAICQGGEIISDKCNSRLRRYESLCAQARAVSSTADLAHLARNLLNNQPSAKPPRRAFLPPYPPEPDDPPMDIQQESMPPVLRGEMLLDRMGIPQARLSYEQLRKDSQDLELQIKQLQDHLESLARVQVRGIEGNVYSKVNEIQEEMSMKKYDYRTAQLHLAAVRAQNIMSTIFNIEDYIDHRLPRVILTDYTSLQNMKNNKSLNKTRDYVEDDNVRYKINKKYFKQQTDMKDSEENILYKFPEKKIQNKLKAKVNKPKIKTKVKFWTGKKSLSRLENLANNEETNRRHTIAANASDSTGAAPSMLNNSHSNNICILPPSQFTDHHVPMVAVPDDLIMNLNERGLSNFNNLGDDINNLVNGCSSNNSNEGEHNPIYDNELEFFSKYVVQKLRNMETNQRIFAENLVNTALMLGQLGKLNIKSKITDS